MTDKKNIYACAADVLTRIARIEEKLEDHIDREEKTQVEIKWGVRLIFASMVGIIVQQFMT